MLGQHIYLAARPPARSKPFPPLGEPPQPTTSYQSGIIQPVNCVVAEGTSSWWVRGADMLFIMLPECWGATLSLYSLSLAQDEEAHADYSHLPADVLREIFSLVFGNVFTTLQAARQWLSLRLTCRRGVAAGCRGQGVCKGVQPSCACTCQPGAARAAAPAATQSSYRSRLADGQQH